VTHWLLSSGVTGAVSVALVSLDAAAEVLLEGAGLADVDAVVVLPLEQPVITIALIATAANNHLVDIETSAASVWRCTRAVQPEKTAVARYPSKLLQARFDLLQYPNSPDGLVNTIPVKRSFVSAPLL
jgi:hypothetical protein